MKKKFTILELLIVTFVILILLSLLFPALNSARSKAKEGACLNNKKQILTYEALYGNDSAIYVYPVRLNNGNWYTSLNSTGYLKEKLSAICTNNRYINLDHFSTWYSTFGMIMMAYTTVGQQMATTYERYRDCGKGTFLVDVPSKSTFVRPDKVKIHFYLFADTTNPNTQVDGQGGMYVFSYTNTKNSTGDSACAIQLAHNNFRSVTGFTDGSARSMKLSEMQQHPVAQCRGALLEDGKTWIGD